MKRIIALVIVGILLAFGLTGCDKYVSNWNAAAFVHSNTSKSACMNFLSFDGTIVYKLKCGNT